MDRQVSLHRPEPTEVNIHEVMHLLEGQLEDLPPINSKIIRVFVSSTFSGWLLDIFCSLIMRRAKCHPYFGKPFSKVGL